MAKNRLTELREGKGMTPTHLAYEMGVHPDTIRRWATGVSEIKDEKKQQLAELFGVSVSFLMGWDEER